MLLTSHKILVTGGSQGIGLALANALAPANDLVVVGRDPQRLNAAAASTGAHPLRADLIKDDPAKIIAHAQETLGGLTVLINNAAIQHPTDWLNDPPEAVADRAHAQIATNLTAPAALIAHALPHLQQAEHAAIINLSSGLAYAPKRSAPIYCATKAALSTFTTALRYQTQDAGTSLSVHEIILPLVDTAMTAGRAGKVDKIRPDHAAQAILKGVESGQDIVWVGKMTLMRQLLRYTPSLARRILRNS